MNFAHPAGPPPRDPAALRNEFPVETPVAGGTYPSLHHAFHALSILDDAGREAVAAEPMGMRVPYIAAEYPERPEWPAVRLAVMTELLRAEFREHPDLADILVSTGDARIVYQSLEPR
ncbi:NADAR family protein [Streptomycetaceae bacterium NBC_01309]